MIAVRDEISVVADTVPVIMGYTTVLLLDAVSADVGDFIVVPEKILHEYVGVSPLNVIPGWKPLVIDYDSVSVLVFDAKRSQASTGPSYF